MRFEVTQIGDGDNEMFFLTINEEHVLSDKNLKKIQEQISKFLEVRFN